MCLESGTKDGREGAFMYLTVYRVRELSLEERTGQMAPLDRSHNWIATS